MKIKTPITKNVNPCLKCGKKGILAEHCGFTAGEARCSNKKCNNKVQVKVCNSEDPYESIRNAWNEANPIFTKKIEDINDQIRKLQNEKRRLKKLFDENGILKDGQDPCPKCGGIKIKYTYTNCLCSRTYEGNGVTCWQYPTCKTCGFTAGPGAGNSAGTSWKTF